MAKTGRITLSETTPPQNRVGQYPSSPTDVVGYEPS